MTGACDVFAHSGEIARLFASRFRRGQFCALHRDPKLVEYAQEQRSLHPGAISVGERKRF